MRVAPEHEAWIDKARGADILAAAHRLGATLKRAGHEHVGPCPACGGTDRFSVNTRKMVFNCRGADGGDVIRMVMHVKQCDFKEAVAWLTDEAAPAQAPKVKPKSAAQLEAEDNEYRAKQIKIARSIWARGVPIEGTAAQAYLAARGIDALPPGYELRFSAAERYWRPEDFAKDDARPIHVGPALLAVLTDPLGAVVGCHITWLDPAEPNGKIAIPDPDDTGKLLPAKKLRGSKRRAAERIQNPKGGGKRLVIGEGRETVLSVWLAEREMMKAAWTYYWSAIDLGHLGGKAKHMVKHPTKLRADGKPLMVPGPEPELQPERELVIPDEVTEIVLLGDGDSDRFTTEMALRRACARWDRQGRVIKIAWAPDGTDFNDLLRGQ